MNIWNTPVELAIPAAKKMMLIVRMTTVGVASQFGMTLDAMDDMKMAVEEACHCFMLQPNPFPAIHLRFERADDALRIRICGAGERIAGDGRREICTMDVLRCILESMVDEVTFTEDDAGIQVIEMRKRLNWTEEK